ncbi:MAG: diacylglycerol kinase [Nitrospirae bacterium]|nr:diacylglycerol kinase [Nitrospirota bacterium]
MPLRKWIEGANYAIEGILHAAKTQKHLRYHFYAAVLVLLLSFISGISRFEFIAIAIVVVLVLLAEMLNTAIEATIDLISREYNPKAKIAKDIAAGAVLVTASGAVVIGFIILLPPLKNAFYEGIKVAKHTGEDIAIIALVLVIISVIITKAYFGKGLPLRGGLPSGHAAVAFSVWVAVTFLSESFLPSLLVFILAVLIAQSRVTVGAHRPWEVILGAMVGAVVTFFLFKMFL